MDYPDLRTGAVGPLNPMPPAQTAQTGGGASLDPDFLRRQNQRELRLKMDAEKAYADQANPVEISEISLHERLYNKARDGQRASHEGALAARTLELIERNPEVFELVDNLRRLRML